jgi:hypothetical protein
MRKSLLIILLVLVASIVSVQGIIPSRCIFSREIMCMNFDIDPVNNEVNFLFRNNLNEDAEFFFKAWISENDMSSAVSCLCNGAASCNLNAQGKGNVTCAFSQGSIASKGATKIEFKGNYTYLNNPLNRGEIDGSLYVRLGKGYANYLSLGFFILYIIISIGILVLLIYIIKWLGKQNAKKERENPGLRGFVMALAVLFVPVNAAVLWMSSRTEFGITGVHPIYAPVYVLTISLLPAIIVGIIVGIVFHFKNKKKSAKK